MGARVDGVVGRTTSSLLAVNALPSKVTVIFLLSTSVFNTCETFAFPLVPLIVKVTLIEPQVMSLTTSAFSGMPSFSTTTRTNSC